MDSSGSGYGTVAGFCEDGNEHSSFIKFLEIIDNLGNYKLRKNNSAAFSYFYSIKLVSAKFRKETSNVTGLLHFIWFEMCSTYITHESGLSFHVWAILFITGPMRYNIREL
jgi:hypothetical protein